MHRRAFLETSGMPALSLLRARVGTGPDSGFPDLITLFLGGDVMSGRGIDQILPHPNDPEIYEPEVRSALAYLELAERGSGRIQKPVDFAYIWGDGLSELERRAPDARIINLETAVTRSERRWLKNIHYRMHPKNVPCITAARIDCCVLANNHVLDWGEPGLVETLSSLEGAGLKAAGAGRHRREAEAPATLDLGGQRRVLVFAFCTESSGIPREWGATEARAGVNLLADFSDRTVERIGELVREVKQPRDLAVASIHWGPNWGYRIPREHTVFAHRLIDVASIDVVQGHSSHHPLGIEVHEGRPVLYGCGDLLNDYEGIPGYEEYRGDLVSMYFVTMDAVSGTLVRLTMTPLQIRRFRLNRASPRDAEWLHAVLDRECARLGSRVEMNLDGTFELRWPGR